MIQFLCDYDGPPPRDLCARVCRVRQALGLPAPVLLLRKSRRGWHATVTFVGRVRSLSRYAIVAAQLFLGSDPNREIMNLTRVRQLARMPPTGRVRWNLLFSEHVRYPTR